MVRRQAHTELNSTRGRLYGTTVAPPVPSRGATNDGLANGKIVNTQHSARWSNPFGAHSKTMRSGTADVARRNQPPRASLLSRMASAMGMGR